MTNMKQILYLFAGALLIAPLVLLNSVQVNAQEGGTCYVIVGENWEGKVAEAACPTGFVAEAGSCYFVVNGAVQNKLKCDKAQNGNYAFLSYLDGDGDETDDTNTTGGDGATIGEEVDGLTGLQDNPIVELLVDVLSFLAAGVGFVVAATLIWGGIQYMTSGGNPQQTTAARNKIINALIAIALYALAVVFLNWLIPGGVFR